MPNHQPIVAATCEDRVAGRSLNPLVPELIGSHDQFLVQDPFGLRRAVVPVFVHEPASGLTGIGTAFQIDGWGTLLTAAHVIDQIWLSRRPFEQRFSTGPDDLNVVVLLGIGLCYGIVHIPSEALAPIHNIWTPVRERIDPLAALRGITEMESAGDIAVMRLTSAAPAHMLASLPLRLSGWRPRKGDTVLAVGFPELACQPVDDDALRHLLSEGMYGAYGQIINAHPEGRGANFPTPVIEVEANWPAGMSGGPVFNDCGEVVGIVSRSLPPDHAAPGNATAACFELVPELHHRFSTIDPTRPCVRLGWAVYEKTAQRLVGFFEDESEALAHRATLGSSYAVDRASSPIGTDEYILM